GGRPHLGRGHKSGAGAPAAGGAATAGRAGAAALLSPPYSCGVCVPCRRGQEMFCDRHQFTGLSRDGGFAEYVLVDERSLVPLPPGVEPASVAPHADAGITAYLAATRLLPRLIPGWQAYIIDVGG